MTEKEYNKELQKRIEKYNEELESIINNKLITDYIDYSKRDYYRTITTKKVLFVKNYKDGRDICHKIQSATNIYNEERKKLCSVYGTLYRIYKPHIKTINVDNQKIILSKTPAHRSFVFSGKGLKELVDSNYKIEIKYCEEKEKEYIEKQYNNFVSWSKKNIDDKKKYTIHVYSGNAYRITYYDERKNKRIQINMGNYLIIAGKNNSIVDANKRKERSDMLEEMYSVFGISIMKK